jgi:hypothetical protein
VLEPNLPLRPLALGDAHTRSAHHDEEVHTENTDSGVVLDTEINVFFDTEAEVTGGREVAAMSATLRDSTVEPCAPLRCRRAVIRHAPCLGSYTLTSTEPSLPCDTLSSHSMPSPYSPFCAQPS